MATVRPKRPCKWLGCKNYANNTSAYCDEHLTMYLKRVKEQRALRDKNRLSAHKRGYTSRWQKVSHSFLITHPLCAECLKHGKLTPSTEVDHIKPHKGDKKLFWDHDNWQALCHECHSRKTAREDGGFGNAF